jgi:succinoglycan biosynthesis protein ExoM
MNTDPDIQHEADKPTQATSFAQKKVLIAIGTYNRPLMLQACIASLVGMSIPKGIDLTVGIFDNDATRSAERTTESLGHSLPFGLIYTCVPQRGIPIVRNKALEHAFDYLVFIDDDETVAADWLIQLIDFCRKNGGSIVVHGGVDSVCPQGAPSYLIPFFSRGSTRATGQTLKTCATDNVLIPTHLIRHHQIRFDVSRPLAGGTDSLFFDDLHARGITIVECAEARVTEHIPIERMTVRWLARRKFRAGIDVARRKKKVRPIAEIVVSDLLKIIYFTVLTLALLLLFDRPRAVGSWLKVCRASGSLAGLLGLKVDAYKRTDGY